MTREQNIFVCGSGSVSPAGWGTESLSAAWEKKSPLPTQDLARPGWENPLRIRNVPAPTARPAFLAHPRLRRSTSIAQFTVAAALEAMQSDLESIQSGALRLGIIVAVLTGAVTYTRRFYEEVLRQPGTASPLLFPETVFNSSASHLGAYLGSKTLNYTLVGDDGTFLQGLVLAAEWLADDRIDACVVVGAEENDWIIADALHLYRHKSVHAFGAGALYLRKQPVAGGVELAAVTDSFPFTQWQHRPEAVAKMTVQLPSARSEEIFGSDGIKAVFGEAFTASAAWQCALAVDAVRRGAVSGANVHAVGINQQAIGARFVK